MQMETLAFSCGLLSMGLNVQFALCRFGFSGVDWPKLFSTQGLAFFLLFLPGFISRTLTAFFRSRRIPIVTSIGFGLFVTVFSTCLFGFLARQKNFPISFGIVSFGVMLWVGNVWRCCKSKESRPSLLHLILLLILSLFLGATLWGNYHTSPLFIEKMMEGWIPTDTLYHAAIVEMFDLHHLASVGIDGITPHPYHMGSHIWFSFLSRLIDVPPWLFYQLGYSVAVVPFFLFTFFAFANSVRSHGNYQDRKDKFSIGTLDWAVLTVVVIGVLPNLVLFLSYAENFVFVSESLTVAMAFVFSLGVWILDVIERPNTILGENGHPPLFVYGVIPLVTCLIGFTKISLLILLPAGLIFLAGRLFKFSSSRFLMCAVVLVLTTFPLARYLSTPHPLHFSPFYFIRSFVNLPFQPFFHPIFYFWTFLYIGLRVWEENVKTVADLVASIKEKRVLDVEFLAVIAFLGELPLLFMELPGASAWYFGVVAHYLAVALLLVRFPRFLEKAKKTHAIKSDWRSLKITTLGGILFSIPVFITLVMNFNLRVFRLIEDNIQFRTREISRAGLADVYAKSSLKDGLNMLAYIPDQHLADLPYAEIVSALMQLHEMNPVEKKETALFIPESTERYWLRDSDKRYLIPFTAPGLAGLPMLGGLGPNLGNIPTYYGYNMLDLGRLRRENQLTSADDICDLARKAGFEKVVVLLEKDQHIVTQTLDCDEKINDLRLNL